MPISNSTWIDVLTLAMSVGLLEAAFTGKGSTHGRGRKLYWPVAPWLRPILGMVGFALLAFALVHFFSRLAR
jgi:hypothetical protein